MIVLLLEAQLLYNWSMANQLCMYIYNLPCIRRGSVVNALSYGDECSSSSFCLLIRNLICKTFMQLLTS